MHIMDIILNIRAPVVQYIIELRRNDKMLDKSRIYLFSSTRLTDSIRFGHSCKVLYIHHREITSFLGGHFDNQASRCR